MVSIFKRAKQEAGYHATYFIQMISRNGGLETARQLLRSPKVSDGFTALWERRRLDLSVEATVLEPRFTDLFSEEVRDLALARLKEYGYTPPTADAGLPSRMSTSLVEEHDYDPARHAAGTRAASAKCSWHGKTCDRQVVASVLTRDRGGTTWHAVCEPALHSLRHG